MVWYLIAGAIAMLVPVGLVLMGVAGLAPERAWDAALGALGAIGLAGVAYWAIGFALQFGGIGLAYHLNSHFAVRMEFTAGYPDYEATWNTDVLRGE